MLDRLLLPELREAVTCHDWATFAEMNNVLHPTFVAELLETLEETELVASALAHVEPKERALLFEYLGEEMQDGVVTKLPRADLAAMIEAMSHDDRVDLVKRMDDDLQAVVMPLVARADREDILRLSEYREGTAGSIMTTDYAALPADITVGQAIDRLRREAPDRETIYYVYVVDPDRHLVGFVSLKDLILASPRRSVSQVMRSDVLSVRVEADVEVISRTLADYDVIALPVVDSENRLVGIITHDDVIDVVIEEATEDAHRMGAVEPLDTDYLESPFWLIVRKRVVWLGLLFGAEMFTSLVLTGYEELLAVFTGLIVFMPVITATGGNSGSQSVAMITRSLALGQVRPSDWLRIAFRELVSGIVLGATVGMLGIIAVAGMGFRGEIALVLVLALVTVTTVGSLVGALMPLVFKQIGLDPAISSGPFVASMVDVVGLFLYCQIAVMLLSHPGP